MVCVGLFLFCGQGIPNNYQVSMYMRIIMKSFIKGLKIHCKFQMWSVQTMNRITPWVIQTLFNFGFR